MTEPEEKSGLETAIDRLFVSMSKVEVTSDEYAKMINHQVKLHSLKQAPRRVSPDTIAIIAANLAGIALIIRHEHANVLMSKALNFVPKLR